MTQTPYKGPIRNLQEYIEKRDQKFKIQTLASSFPNMSKWTRNSNIDNPTSTDFWIHPEVIDSQITCFLKFRYNQYMDNACKQLFFGSILYPSLHVLYATPQKLIHGPTYFSVAQIPTSTPFILNTTIRQCPK